jgi:hypothetical protein
VDQEAAADLETIPETEADLDKVPELIQAAVILESPATVIAKAAEAVIMEKEETQTCLLQSLTSTLTTHAIELGQYLGSSSAMQPAALMFQDLTASATHVVLLEADAVKKYA